MGATNIHYKAPMNKFKHASDAFKALREEELYNHGDDPYSGTIATCTYAGKVEPPRTNEQYDDLLDRIGKRECVVYEKDGYYNFVGWAAC